MLVVAKESKGGLRALWSVSFLGGAPRKILEEVGNSWMSPDGNHIAYTKAPMRDIWIAGPHGESPRSVMAVPEGENLQLFGWSPDSRRLVYTKRKVSPEGLILTLGSRGLEGGAEEEILSDLAKDLVLVVPGFWWMPDGRFVYPFPEPPPHETDIDLWAVHVDLASGERTGAPERITHWGEQIRMPSATADGRRLAVLRSRTQTDIYLADLEPGGKALRNPRRFTMDERDDFAPAWTPDSRFVVFSSSRGGTLDLFRQGVDATTAESVIVAPDQQVATTVTPDGGFVLYSDFKGSKSLVSSLLPADAAVMKVPVAGGPPQFVFDKKKAAVSCPSMMGTPCVMREFAGVKMVISAWDPDKGAGATLASLDWPDGVIGPFGLSPDGSQIAMASGYEESRITILTLADGKSRTLSIDENLRIKGLAWSASMDALFATVRVSAGHVAIVRIDLRGGTENLLELEVPMLASLAPSPDGRYLAFTVLTVDQNVWLLENF